MDTKFEDIVSEIKTIVDLFPENIAIIEDGIPTLTYSQMWGKATCVANRLKEINSSSEYVIVKLSKSSRYIIAILGCWLAGKAFVPIGKDLPDTRKKYIEDIVDTDLSITECNFDDFLKSHPVNHIEKITGSTPAYIIFSSGTTGKPKGILVGHSGLVNLARSQRKAFRITEHSRNLFFLSINFDASISDIIVTLTSGAALVIESTDSVELSANLMHVIEKRRVTHTDIPPSVLRVTNANDCPQCLETIVIGGEVTDKVTVQNWANKVNLVNVYGPTEATVCTSLCQCTEDWTVPVIGKEIQGVTYHIHDDDTLDADDGELWISGECLAIGYFKNEVLTKEKFPIVNNRRYYRTSDHVRRTDDGNLEFIGRYDRQVKFHGQLIELEEIESTLKLLRLVRNAAVVKRVVSERNSKEIIAAFVEVGDTTDAEEATKYIRKALRHHLPKWMIPGHIELIQRLPKVTSGKVDYSALSVMELKNFSMQPEENYLSDKEEIVAKIMADILKISRVNPNENFFDLGADSLDTLLLIARLQNEVKINITLDQLKHHATPFAICSMSSQGKSMAMFSKELADDWKFNLIPQFVSDQSNGNTVFITGATGFLGAHILAELIEREDYRNRDIVCLVRCASSDHGVERIRETFSRYNLNALNLGRVKIISGDLVLPEFGLDYKDYEKLAIVTSEVYHCAATVNMMADYETLKPQNVTATKSIVQFCLNGRRKKLNYASTLSVFVSTNLNEGVALETDRLDNPCIIYGGYGQTKYVCEKFLLNVPSELCGINIIRYGLLCGDTTNGISAPKDFLGMFIRGAKLVKALPVDSSGKLGIDISPIDIASKMTVDIATKSDGGIYHIASENPLSYSELCKAIEKNANVKILENYEIWKDLLIEFQDNANVTALDMSLCRLDENAYNSLRYMDLFQTTNIHFDMTNTHRLTEHRIYQNDKLIELYIKNEKI
ncbi:MAG: thioester reductase domain-containing protein [Paludibacteraceae bacterium]|nr:thioester reductase domain-containing protein [Paludibacteraceae bacterium]